MQGQHRLHQGKFVAYDPSAKVPLLIRGPGDSRRDSVSKELVSNVDIVPTILDAGERRPRRHPGRPLAAPLRERPCAALHPPDPARDRPPDRDLRPASASASGKPKFKKKSIRVKNLDLDRTAQLAKVVKPPKYRAIRTGRYLLIKYSDGGRELYDMPATRFRWTRSGRTRATSRCASGC